MNQWSITSTVCSQKSEVASFKEFLCNLKLIMKKLIGFIFKEADKMMINALYKILYGNKPEIGGM